MIKTSSPTRVDLAGGTLDCWPIYLLVGDCKTVNLSIGIETGVELTPRNDCLVTLQVDSLDYQREFASLNEVLACKDKELTLLRPHLAYWHPSTGFDLSTFSQSPVGGGLGGSSSLCISLLKAFCQWQGREMQTSEMVTVASNIEAKILAMPTGTQDYFPAITPGLNIIDYSVEGPKAQCLSMEHLEDLYEHLVVVYTGRAHHSGINNWQVLKAAIEGDKKTLQGLNEIAEVSQEMAEVCQNHQWSRMSSLFQREFSARIKLCEAFTSPEIEKLQTLAIEAGATAIKICGAGGGGSVLLWCDPGKREQVESLCQEKGFQVLPLKPQGKG